jgi:cytidylate kinase
VAVITISRQMGSLGCEIAREIAVCLGYRVVWREVINEAASRAGVPEVALATIDELDFLGLRPTAEARNAYHESVREIMRELAEGGSAVIVGRAGQVILRGVESAFHVRLYAPFDLRVERIAERHQISFEAARGQVQSSDTARTRYLKRYYKARWDDPDLYDVQINTARMSTERAAAMVCELVQLSRKMKTHTHNS